MGVIVEKGTKFKTKIKQYGDSLYCLLPPAVVEYLKFAKDMEVAIVCEYSDKHKQPFIGIGQLRSNVDAIEADPEKPQQ